MNEERAFEELLDGIEESLEEDNVYGLYLFSWFLSEYQLTDDQKQAVYDRAYAEINRRLPLRLVWVPWPIDLTEAVDVEPGTPLDFTLDPDAPVTTKLMALVRTD